MGAQQGPLGKYELPRRSVTRVDDDQFQRTVSIRALVAAVDIRNHPSPWYQRQR